MKRNNSGPRIDPWGTPLVAFLAGSFLVHLNILFLSDQQIMHMTLPLVDYAYDTSLLSKFEQ